MSIIRKLTTLFQLERAKKKLLVEAFLYLAIARILKAMPFSKVAPMLGIHMDETTFEGNPTNRELMGNISDVIHIAGKYAFWESECLVKAIAAMKMLERRNISSTVYFGTARDHNGKLIAHAWIRSGTYYLTGVEGKEKFTVVGKFANK